MAKFRSRAKNFERTVLDSIYFSSGYRIRCELRIMTQLPGKKKIITQAGPPVKSLSKLVSRPTTGICHNQAVDHARLQAPSFIANLRYLPPDHEEHPNKIEIVIQIPHEDGLLPLISTEPMNHIDYLLNSRMYQEQHICSNVHLAKPETDFKHNDPGFSMAENKQGDSGFTLPFQLNQTLRSDQTVRLYGRLAIKL